jgi:hypothetical protein
MPQNYNQFKLGYQVSPIILTGGLAARAPDSMLPIVSIIESAAYPAGLLSQGTNLELDNCFAFQPLPGGTLIKNDIGKYPFANLTVAANAIIAEPVGLSLLMLAPVRASNGGYLAKLSTISNLVAALQQHITLGGTFTVATPAYFYTNCILLGLTDVSSRESKQVQSAWQWDFTKPLVALADAAQAQNTLMSKITSGLPVSGDPPSNSGTANAGANPSAGISSSLVPAAQPLAGTSVPGANPFPGNGSGQ